MTRPSGNWSHRVVRVCVSLMVASILTAVSSPPANAARPPAPGPPKDLQVDDQPDALGVDLHTATFSWHVSDSRRNAIQSGYRIVVTQRRTPGSNVGTVIWDSDKVVSSRDAFVSYAGPALIADVDYWWTVQTWDGIDHASAFANPARVHTALEDADWHAAWIRRGSAQHGVEDYTYLRKQTTLGASPIRRAWASVSASHQFELRVNGVMLERGPVFAEPDHQRFTTTDITRAVKAGEPNAFGIFAHWYGPGKGRPAAAPGAIARIVVEHRDGTRDVIVTDGSWRVHAAPWIVPAEFRNDEGDFVEHADGRLDVLGWDRAGFDDSAWEAATVVGQHPTAPWTHLLPQTTRIDEQRLAPVSVARTASGGSVADFGTVVTAYRGVKLAHGVAGRRVGFRAGFRLDRDGQVSLTHATQATDMVDSYIERDGAQQFHTTGFLAFRYLQIDGADEPLPKGSLVAITRHSEMPDEHAATFSSSNSMLDRVFELARHSALYASQEQFLDTPTREKGGFLRDGANISSTTMRAFGERNLTKQELLDFADSQVRYWPDGRVNALFPTDEGARDIPDFTEFYPEWVWRYVLDTDDRQLLASVYPTLTAIAGYLSRAIDPTTGLVTNLPGGGTGDYQYGLVDWPPAMRYGYDIGTAARTTINALAVNALRRVRQAGELLGRPAAELASLQATETALIRAMNARLTRPDGTYVDGLEANGSQSHHVSEHANAEALAFGVVPSAQQHAVGNYIARLGMRMGPQTVQSLLDALHATNRDDALVRITTDPKHDGWAAIIAQGGTYTWESWILSDSEGDSESHAWGATVLVNLQQDILGVAPTSPGFATVDVRLPTGGLAHASGSIPTQQGPITVAWARRGATTHLDLTIPPNERASVHVSPTRVRNVGAGRWSLTISPR